MRLEILGAYDLLWRENSYIKDTFMCLSFRLKHLSLGRGGMILLDDKEAYNKLSKMVYDGRIPIFGETKNVSTIGYHYYMTPETQLGVDKFLILITTEPRKNGNLMIVQT